MSSRGGTRGGRGDARGRGRGRGGGFRPPPQGAPSGAPSLAAQMRQVDRLSEPEELKALRRFKDFGAVHVRSTYGLSGRLDWELGVPIHLLPRGGLSARGSDPVQYFRMLDAENALAVWTAEQDKERALSRRVARLPAARHETPWESLSQEERRLLLLSNRAYQSFRSGEPEPSSSQAVDE